MHKDRRETDSERYDRNWDELMQELRVTQTGVQILSGFLLTVPFQSRFGELSQNQKLLYLVLVSTAALATVLLVAPVGMHRVLFQRGRKDWLVRMANTLARVGLICLSLVVSGVLLLIFDIVVGPAAAIAASGTVLLLSLGAWFVVPILRDRRTED